MSDEVFDTVEKYEKIIPDRCTLDEHLAIQKYFHALRLKKNIICTALCFLLAVLLYFLKAEFYIIAIALFATCLMLGQLYSTLVSIKKNAKSGFVRSPQFRIEWNVYCDSLEYKAYRGEVEELSYRIAPEKISRIKDLGSIYVFEYMQSIFAIPKSSVAEGTTFFNLLFPSGAAKDKTPISDTLGFWYDCFAMATWAYVAVGMFSFVKNAELWWVALIGLPFPIVTIAMWIAARYKGIKLNIKAFDLVWMIAVVVLSIYSLIF